jgi:4-oxalocrotonate tautomerase
MPHVIIKMLAGRTAEQKDRIAAEVTKAVMATAGSTADDVSVAIEDVAKRDWVEAVYKPDILGRSETLYKKPGYDPLAPQAKP